MEPMVESCVRNYLRIRVQGCLHRQMIRDIVFQYQWDNGSNRFLLVRIAVWSHYGYGLESSCLSGSHKWFRFLVFRQISWISLLLFEHRVLRFILCQDM